MLRAIAYIRVSDQRQVEDGSSLTTQEKQVITYAASKDYTLLRVFTEEGESAKTDQRPKLRELLAYCKDRRNAVHVLIVPKIDRLARNAHDYASLKRQLSAWGIQLESIGERIEDTPVGRFTESIMASVAQLDNEIRAERSKGGMVEAVSQGRWVWQAPKGYRNIRFEGKGTIEPFPAESRPIQQAFEMLAKRKMAPLQVHDFLKASGLALSTSSFYTLMRNPVYIGKIRAFGGVYSAVPPFVPLVSPETFYKAGACIRAAMQPKSYTKHREEFPLRGTLICSQCGRFYTSYWSKGKRLRYAYYGCKGCKRRIYSASRIHADFAKELEHYKPLEENWLLIEESLIEYDREHRKLTTTIRKKGKQSAEELVKLQESIALKNAAGVIPDKVAKKKIAELEIEIEDTFASLPMSGKLRDLHDILSFAKAFFSNLGQSWESMSLELKKDLQRFLFPSGIIHNGNDGCRTPENSFSEQLKSFLHNPNYGLVDLNPDFMNTFLDGMERLSKLKISYEGNELGEGPHLLYPHV